MPKYADILSELKEWLDNKDDFGDEIDTDDVREKLELLEAKYE